MKAPDITHILQRDIGDAYGCELTASWSLLPRYGTALVVGCNVHPYTTCPSMHDLHMSVEDKNATALRQNVQS